MIAILLLMIIIPIRDQLKLYHCELHQDDIVRFKVTGGVKNTDHFNISKTRFYKVVLHYMHAI